MANPWKERVLRFNKKRAQADEKAADLMTLISALPPGQAKNLMKDETCAAILKKYGVTVE